MPDNVLQAALIKRYFERHNYSDENAAARVWICKHAAQFRRWYDRHFPDGLSSLSKWHFGQVNSAEF